MDTVANGGMWSVAAEVETLLDGSDCDWRTLQRIEGMLSSLSHQLERAAAARTSRSPARSTARRAREDLQVVQTALSWVRRHEYDALESELQNRLEPALQSAMTTLGWLAGDA
jgi:hypothetical protein